LPGKRPSRTRASRARIQANHHRRLHATQPERGLRATRVRARGDSGEGTV